MKHILLFALCCVAGCGAGPSASSSRAAAAAAVMAVPSASVRLDRVALTTAVDSITMGPAAPDRRNYPTTVERLFLCFRTNGARAGDTLRVSWFREGHDRPFHTTTATMEGDERTVAEYEALDPFRPGRHFARVHVGGEHVADIPFVIDGGPASGIRPPNVAQLRVIAPDGPPANTDGDRPRFASGTSALRAHFAMENLTPANDVSVHWRLGRRVVARTRFDAMEGNNELSANLASDAPLPAGDYVVEVRLDGSTEMSLPFTVEGSTASRARRSGRASGPARVSDLVVTNEACPAAGPPGVPSVPALRSDSDVLYVCLHYENLRSGTPLEVRWYQSEFPDEPMVVTSFEPSGSGDLSASFMPDDRLPPGAYHVAVAVGADQVQRADFNIVP